jgi:septum formation protein
MNKNISISTDALILASSSKRRIEILNEYKIEFIALQHLLIKEPIFTGQMPPDSFVKNIAIEKAKSLENDYQDNFIIGSDTIIFLNSKAMGKPKDLNEAIYMLKELSGKTHEVYTGASLINKNKNIYELIYDKTFVKIKNLTERDIFNYIKNRNPLDKAGGYGIQDKNGIVESYGGSYKNVQGLCIENLLNLLRSYKLVN